MQVFSWQKPQLSGRKDPPTIPLTYTNFGTHYDVVGGLPLQSNLTKKDVDKEELKKLVEISFSTFVKLITYPEDHEELIEEIGTIHSEINELLNSAKRTEAMCEIRKLRNKHIRHKNSVIEEIKEHITNFTKNETNVCNFT